MEQHIWENCPTRIVAKMYGDPEVANVDPREQSLTAEGLEQSQAGAQGSMLTQKQGSYAFEHLEVDFTNINPAEGANACWL